MISATRLSAQAGSGAITIDKMAAPITAAITTRRLTICNFRGRPTQPAAKTFSSIVPRVRGNQPEIRRRHQALPAPPLPINRLPRLPTVIRTVVAQGDRRHLNTPTTPLIRRASVTPSLPGHPDRRADVAGKVQRLKFTVPGPVSRLAKLPGPRRVT